MVQINTKEKSMTDEVSEVKIDKLNKTKRWAVVGVVGLLLLTLLIGATVAGIYVGKNMTKDIYEEAWATYRNTDTNSVLKKRYIIDGKELSIVKPGEIGVVLDFDKHQAVMQIDGMRVKPSNDCLCFVYDFDPSSWIDFEDLVSMVHVGNIFEYGKFPVKHSVLQIHRMMFDPNDLSKRSREICHGCKILRATLNEKTDVKESPRRKRGDAYCDESQSSVAHFAWSITIDDSVETGGITLVTVAAIAGISATTTTTVPQIDVFHFEVCI